MRTGVVSGFSGYVTLSRAKTRQGLALTTPVTLDSLLRSPLPDCLQRELRRHEAMEENTLKKHGFMTGVQRPVQGPNDVGSFRVIMDGEVVTTIEARKSDEGHVRENNGKRRRLNRQDTPASDVEGASETLAGCEWGPGPTCAYDSIVTTLYYTHMQLSSQLREAMKDSGTILGRMCARFEGMAREGIS